MPWTPDGPRIRAMREKRGFSIAALANIVRVHEKTIRRIEGGETTRIYPGTLLEIAKALSCEMDSIGTWIDRFDRVKKGELTTRAAPPLPGRPMDLEPVETKAKRRRRTDRPPAIETFSARALDDISNAFRVHEDGRYRVVGRVESQTAVTDLERHALGCAKGVGVRFLVSAALSEGETKGITVYAATAAATRQLQAGLGQRAMTFVARVAVVELPYDPPTLRGDEDPNSNRFMRRWPGFSIFGEETKAYWALVVGAPTSRRKTAG